MESNQLKFLKNSDEHAKGEPTRQMPDMHISFVPILQGVPFSAESPHATIIVSSLSVQ